MESTIFTSHVSQYLTPITGHNPGLFPSKSLLKHVIDIFRIATPLQDDIIFHKITIIENCIFLTIWNSARKDEKLPVMAWIHGGEITGCTARIPAFQGTSFAKKGNPNREGLPTWPTYNQK